MHVRHVGNFRSFSTPNYDFSKSPKAKYDGGIGLRIHDILLVLTIVT